MRQQEQQQLYLWLPEQQPECSLLASTAEYCFTPSACLYTAALLQGGASTSRAHDLFNSIAGPSTAGPPQEWDKIFGSQVRALWV